MKSLFIFLVIIGIVLADRALTLEDVTWKDPSTLMNGDLQSRMNRRVTTRRRSCNCDDAEEDEAICGSTGFIFPNICLFECAQLRDPTLEEADYDVCSKTIYSEYKPQHYASHY